MRARTAWALAVALAAGCASGGGQSRPSPEPSPGVSVSASPLASIPPIGVRAQRSGSRLVGITVKRNGRTLYVIDADSNESHQISRGSYLSTFVRPHVVFYDKAGLALASDAAVAEADTGSKLVTMNGTVHARTHDGAALVCDQLVYDDVRERIRGTGNVTMTTPGGEELHGDAIDADVRLQHVEIGRRK
jgi:LPS export ABC transporter protein LptC